jgi:carbonic anhydrase/acetyltransferase-like protein (isoleucine patch superfamily)
MAIIKPFNGIYPRIADDAFIADNAVIIGDVEIGPKASIWYGCVIRGDVNHIKIGAGSNIQDNSTIHVSRKDGPTIVGKGVTVGHKALLHACILEDYSFIGMGAVLLDGSIVETNGMLAAGALLTQKKVVARGELWAGSPAKFFRLLSQEEIDYIPISEANYIELSGIHKGLT